MLRSIVLTAPPSAPVVTLAEAKAHLRVDSSDEDMLIQGLIDAAVQHLDGLDGVLGRALSPQSYEATFDVAPAYRLPIGPLVSAATVELDGLATVAFVAGYPDGVPAPIRHAILLHVGSLYENREQSAKDWQPTRAYEALLAPYRTWL